MASVLPLLMATLYALYKILTRLLGPRETPIATLFYTVLVGAIAMTALLPFFWQTPTPATWTIMIGIGGIGLFGLPY